MKPKRKPASRSNGSRRLPCAHFIRFTEAENERLHAVADSHGKTIQSLLRDTVVEAMSVSSDTPVIVFLVAQLRAAVHFYTQMADAEIRIANGDRSFVTRHKAHMARDVFHYGINIQAREWLKQAKVAACCEEHKQYFDKAAGVVGVPPKKAAAKKKPTKR